MKTKLLILPALLANFLVFSSAIAGDDEKERPEAKPEIVVAANGYPAGSATAEGAACELARAFMKRDAELFSKTCIAPFGGGENKQAYSDFLEQVSGSIKAEAEKKEPSPGGPKKLVKVYAARHLTLKGPASAGYAMHNFHDIMFVDVEVELVAGQKAQNRTLVIRKADGAWYVHPAPHTASLLSAGLNDEDASTKDFSEAYSVRKPDPKEAKPKGKPGEGAATK